MIKRAVAFVVLSVLFSVASLTDVYAEARGPKIFGFQVGMPWEEALQALKSFADKRGLKYEGGNVLLFYIDLEKSNNTSAPYLDTIRFYPKAFGIDGFITKEMFKTICDKFDIPFNKMEPGKTPGGLRFTNVKDGYIVGYGTAGVEIWVITKTSDMILD